MPKLQKKTVDFDWKEIIVTEDDWNSQSPYMLRSMFQQLYLIRAFETKLLKLKNEDLIHGPVHTSVGQEAVAVGTMAGLFPDDGISGTHRAHHQFLAKACLHYLPKRYDPITDNIPEKLQVSINTLLAEIMGLNAGCCGGRGGSMHLCDPKIGVLGTNAIVGGGIPLATGSAFAEKYKNSGNVVVSFFGDGAINQGAFHEAFNLAGLWNIPIIYLLENNHYAVATSLAESSPVPDLSVRASSYGMSGRIVDGNNPLALKLATEEAADRLRDGGKPFLIEAKTFRDFHHAGDVPGSAFGYRTKEEEDEWKKRNPLANFTKELLKRRIINEKQIIQIQTNMDKIIQCAVDFCIEQTDTKRTIKPKLIPSHSSVLEGLRGDGHEFDNIQFAEPERFDCNKKISYVEAIAAVTGRWMGKNKNVFLIGEEVGHMKGGPYLASKGLPKRFPDQIFNTPISEAGFIGLAGGAAMSGLRPVIEIMFPDFALVAADQIFNQIGKLRHMYGGENIDIPVVMRTRIAVGCGYGGQHSMDPTALFALFSGWQIVAPTTPADYIGLFNSAMQSKDPVLIIEHHELYNQKGDVPDTLDYFIKIGDAKKVMEGNDVTVLAHSWSVLLAKQAADELKTEGINVDLIDLRTVSMPDIDYDMIGESIMETGNIIIIEQSPESNSIGARIGYECQRRFFDYLDGPIWTVIGMDVPTPVSKWTEAATMPNINDIKDIIRESATRQL